MTEEIDWGELGEDWWREAGANCGASNQQNHFCSAPSQGNDGNWLGQGR